MAHPFRDKDGENARAREVYDRDALKPPTRILKEPRRPEKERPVKNGKVRITQTLSPQERERRVAAWRRQKELEAQA